MKPTILTILALFIVLSAGAQKKLNGLNASDHDSVSIGIHDTSIKKDSLFITNAYYTLKIDTQKVWFKELAITGDTITEHWQKGFRLIIPSYISFDGLYVPAEYLYADRKTKVTNYVIFSIERK